MTAGYQEPAAFAAEGGVRIVAESRAMREILSLLKTMSYTDSTILISGESGTGKELISRYIHQHSRRREGAFIPVNCAALPPELIEAELFGYEKGAFTGASREGKAGLFEQANFGTLFLDEIGELPLPLQSKLLRVLENGETKRLGSNRIRTVSTRIIAATNRNLLAMVRQKTFREDLYYRLNVIPVTLPPIRERREDIYPLCVYYLSQLNMKYGRGKRLGKGVRELMEQYAWPGNAREIKNVVERLFVMTPYDMITVSDMPGAFFGEGDGADEGAEEPEADMGELCRQPYREAVRRFEQLYLTQALRQFNGNVTQTAKFMKISRSDLYYKLQNHFPKAAGSPM